MPEVILNRETKQYSIWGCCAKRSILPSKAETSKKQSEVSMVKIPQHKGSKWDIVLSLFLIVFEQSNQNSSNAVV